MNSLKGVYELSADFYNAAELVGTEAFARLIGTNDYEGIKALATESNANKLLNEYIKHEAEVKALKKPNPEGKSSGKEGVKKASEKKPHA
ncbi:MAG: hypothetical protein IJ703_02520 [Eubacterium sp.]|nr:hypothetical protein [Eubacterium sp.]